MKKCLSFTVVMILLFVIHTSAYASQPSGTTTTSTQTYGVENCSEPLSTCGDYYSTHFSADIFKSEKTGSTTKWTIKHVHTKYTYANQNGDEFTVERIGFFGPSITQVYNDYSGYGQSWSNTSVVKEFDENVDLPKNDNIVMFYYKVVLKKLNGQVDATYYPKRYAVDF